MIDYRNIVSFSKRKEEALKILLRYPDKIPIILNGNIDFEKRKYLVNKNMTVFELLHIIRKYTKLNQFEGIYIFVNNKIPMSSSLISQLYEEDRDFDNYLYLDINKEQVFG
jgi:hypothetical protein